MKHDQRIKVGLVCPCNIEYERCKLNLGLSNERELAGRLVSSGSKDNVEIIAIKAGPGKIQCASATQLLISEFDLNFIIDVGASGSLLDDVKLFDIICVTNSYEYDVLNGCFPSISGDLITATMVSENPKAFELINSFSNEISAKIKIGSIACGEISVDNIELKRELQNEIGAIGANWETSAVLKTAEINQVKCFSFRVITDYADEEMKENLKANWETGLDILFSVLAKFINNGWLTQVYQAEY